LIANTSSFNVGPGGGINKDVTAGFKWTAGVGGFEVHAFNNLPCVNLDFEIESS
jgi:hypothetical protein